MSERWLPINGYEGSYEVSDQGRVRSLDRLDARGNRRRGRERTLSRNHDGYLTVALSVGGVGRRLLVHRLVAAQFLAGNAEGKQVCHNDGDPTNNRATNLRWDTPSANVLDQVAHGTHWMSRRSSCANGHRFEDSVLRKDSGRLCRACANEKARRHRARQRAMAVTS